nr:helicase protein MOM1-like isoform X1 [Tanacetum cinerariifolium]
EMFIRYTKNQKKTYVSEDSIPETEPTSKQLLEVKEEIPDSPTTDKVDCQPSSKPPIPSQNLSASSRVSETSARFPNPAVTPRGSNLLNVQRRDNRNQGVSRPYSDPLQNELEKLCELKNNISKFHEVVKLRLKSDHEKELAEKLKLKSDHEKELAEVIAEMNRKYEAKCQDAEAAFQSKRVEIDTSFYKVVKNKMLADAYRSKCQDMSPFDPAILRVQSGGMRFQGQPSMGRSASLSPAQVSRIPQQPAHQIVHQSANLFSS